MRYPIDKTVQTARSGLRRQRGVTLVELMVSMTVGLLIMAAVLAVFAGSRRSFDASESEARMLDNARFALHMLEEDLRSAGSFGRTNWAAGIERRAGTADQLNALGGDCADRWYINLDRKVFGSNEANPYDTTCIPAAANYKDNTDVLVVRYAAPAPVADANLDAATLYVQSVPGHGRLFRGNEAAPTFASDWNHPLQSLAYYVSDNADAGDGVPTLHRVALSAGPALDDIAIAPGVEFFHVQFGIDDCSPECDGAINFYADADHPAIDWNDAAFQDRVLAARIWLLMRADEPDGGNYVDSENYVMGRFNYQPNDSYRRMLVSSVFKIRNGTQP